LRIAVGLLLFVSASLAALAGILYLMLRDIAGPGPNPAKARSGVQRVYDRRWPGRVIVESCAYVEDPEGSIFDTYECQIGIRCRRTEVFSVPRADSMNPLDYDPLLPEGVRPAAVARRSCVREGCPCFASSFPGDS
jgi:hypothetical protein